MNRAYSAVILALLVTVSVQAAPPMADIPYTLELGARAMLPSKTPDALERAGVVFIDVARATRIFDGLVTYADDSVRLTIGRATGDFHVGRATARISGSRLTLPGAPFRKYGTIFVPLSTVVVRLAGAHFHLDGEVRTAQIVVVPRPLEPPPAPSVVAQTSAPDVSGSLQPSLGQALSLTPSASVDAKGLHVSVDVVNRTDTALVATFASSAQVAFLVFRNGTEIWDSTSGKMFAQVETTLTLEPHVVKSFSDVWPGFAAAGAGSYTLRAKILTDPPLISSPASVAPLPAAGSS